LYVGGSHYTNIKGSHNIWPVGLDGGGKMIRQLLEKLPGGPNVKAFVGTALLLGLCAVPVFRKDVKAGHDLFSQEKPQAIIDNESKLKKEYMTKKE